MLDLPLSTFYVERVYLDYCKLLTSESKKSGCNEAEEDDLGHFEVLEAAAAPCASL